MNPDDWDLLGRILKAKLTVNPEPRTLPDGRVLAVVRQMYNSKLTVSKAREWPEQWSEAY